MTPEEQDQTLWEYSQSTYFGFWEYYQIDIGIEPNIFKDKPWQNIQGVSKKTPVSVQMPLEALKNELLIKVG